MLYNCAQAIGYTEVRIIFFFFQTWQTHNSYVHSWYRLYEIRPTSPACRLGFGSNHAYKKTKYIYTKRPRKLQQLDTMCLLRWRHICYKSLGAGGNRSRGVSPGRRDSWPQHQGCATRINIVQPDVNEWWPYRIYRSSWNELCFFFLITVERFDGYPLQTTWVFF